MITSHPDCGRRGGRYNTIARALSQHAHYFRGKHVLDFGASSGLSGFALLQIGAESVTGVEPDAERVAAGQQFIEQEGESRFTLLHTSDTRRLPFADATFGAVLCNAVLEHIPQPRDQYIAEMWRVLAPGGVLFVNETPNKYLPYDVHTLHLPLTNWLPSQVARWVGTITGKIRHVKDPWDYSGWRGLGYYELMGAISSPCRVDHEMTRTRHRVFAALGLPAGLIDPYPVYGIWKAS